MAKASVHNVDFSNVKDGGSFNTKRIEAGDYLAKIMKVEDAPVKGGQNKGTPQYLFTIKLVDHPASTFPYYCQLAENQLWKLRNLLIAAGKTVPKRKSKVDPNTIVGKLIGVLIEDEEYEGKERSGIQGVFPSADLGDSISSAPEDDDEDEEEEDAPLEEEETEEEEDEAEEADDEVEEDEAEEEATDAYKSMTRNQLKAEIIKLQTDFQARKSQTDDDLRGILRGLAEGDEEEDEEPTPPPAKKKAAVKAKAPAEKKAPAKKKSKPKAEDISDDELDELDIDDL